ncbi:REVEILLE 8-like protein [Drosera capensis]
MNSSKLISPPAANRREYKPRKPYTMTKSRENWTGEEHDKFLEALQLFDRDWKKIETFVGSKTAIQIRSHAQKYFSKVLKTGIAAHLPPARPKRRAAHPYPQKSPKNVLRPIQANTDYASSLNTVAPGYPVLDDASMDIPSGGVVHPWIILDLFLMNACFIFVAVADVGPSPRGFSRSTSSSACAMGSSSETLPATKLPQQLEASVPHGSPDVTNVYGFIGSVFDPGSHGHLQKLNEMDRVDFETVLLLMSNLTVNLSSPEFESMKEVLSSRTCYDVIPKGPKR